MSIIEQIHSHPKTIEFSAVINHIDTHYLFTPTAFQNGDYHNAANQNNGSCKIFSFAQLHQLSKEQTLSLFGEYYRKDVLQNPDASDHQNIRNFMKYGWDGIKFDDVALNEK